MAYRSILVGLDFSASNAHTLEIAAELATAYQAQWHLAHILPLNGAGEAEAQAAMKAVALPTTATAGAAGLIASRIVAKALSPDLGLLELAGERRVDLIVLGTHGRSGLQHIRLGSTAERVVQHARCPVLTVRDPRFSYQRP